VQVDPNKKEILNIKLDSTNHSIISLSEVNEVIGEITKLQIIDNHLILFDGELKCIDLNSFVVKRLAKEGKGPNEYLSLTSIKTRNDGVYFSDRKKMKLHKVSFDGIPLNEIDLNSYPSDFEFVNDSIIIIYHGSFPFEGKHYRLSLYNIVSRKFVKHFIKYPKIHYNYLHYEDWNNFSSYNNQITIGYSGSNILYTINKNMEVIPKIKFDFGEQSLTEEILSKDYNEVFEFDQVIDSKGIFCQLISFYDIGCSVIVGTRVSDKPLLYILNKATKLTRLFDRISINNSTPFEICYGLIPVGVDKDYLIFLINPVILEGIEPLHHHFSSNKKLSNKALYPTSNPLIMRIKIDEFIK
jgi:hypothetical protein